MIEPFHKLKFHARGVYYDEIRAATKYFVNEKGATTPCVVYQDTDYGQEIFEAARDQAAVMGLELAGVSAHKPTENEFTAAILRLRNAGCDLVLMGTVVRDTILILETARKMGWDDVAWVGNNAAYNQAVADQESGAAEGYYAFVHMEMIYRDNPRSEEVAAWWDKFVEKYGRNPEYIAFEAYRNADLIVKGLENAGRDLTVDSLIAGSDDDVFQTIEDVNVAVVIDSTDIASIQPAITNRLGRFFRLVPVTLYDAGTPDQNFTVVGDFHVDPGDRLAHTADSKRIRLVGRGECRTFRLSIDLVHWPANRPIPVDQVRSNRRSSG